MNDTAAGHQQKRIFLIRHARPMVDKKGWFNAAAAHQYITDYDAAEVEEFVLEHETIPYQDIKRVYCSSLIRSQLTAKAIFGKDTEFVIDHNFREFERKIFSLPLLRLPIQAWLVTARLLWFLGLNSQKIESFREARRRIKQCTITLEKEASMQGVAVLVAHGMLNNFIMRELKQKGWKKILKGGSDFVSVNILEYHQ